MAEELWSCPECEITAVPKSLLEHFRKEHQPVETDIRYNHYISFPHEQIPRFIDEIPRADLPRYRESYLDTQLIQLFQQVRLTPQQYSTQLTTFAALKSRIEWLAPDVCSVDPAWDELPRLALSSSAFDVVIRLSRTYVSAEKLEKYKRLDGETVSRVAKIGGSFLKMIRPTVREIDENTVCYYCKSKETISAPHERRVPGQDPSFTFKLKYIGLYFQSNSLFFDMSAYNNIAFIRVKLIKAYTDLSPMVSILCVVLKYWGEQRRITGKQLSLLSPFCLFVMVIHFLQNFPSNRSSILPQLQQNFPRGDYFRSPTEGEMAQIRNCPYSLGRLFYEFFRYYASFNWKGVGLSMRKAGILAKPEGQDVLIENPLPPYDNLADQYTERTAFFKMAHEFKRAYMLITSSTVGMKQPKAFESSLFSLLMDPSSY